MSTFDKIATALYLISSLALIGIIIRAYLKSKEWGISLLEVEVEDKWAKLWYILLIFGVPGIIYNLFPGKFSLEEISYSLLFTLLSLINIYKDRSKMKITEDGINYGESYIEWNDIEKYNWDDGHIEITLKNKARLIRYNIAEMDKKKEINRLIKERIKEANSEE